MSLIPIDNYPRNEASGIPRNATVWMQFNKTLSASTVSYITVSAAAPDNSYMPVEGTIELAESSGGLADNIIKFSPDPGWDAYKRYGLFITGKDQGIKSYDGDALQTNLEFFFTIGGDTVSNPDVAATGVPEISGYIPTSKLQVLSTYPSDESTNISVSGDYIKIQFNDAIPTGINLYEYISITNRDVL